MSKLSGLMAKPKVFTIEGVELTIHPLKVNDLDLLMTLEDKDKAPQAMKEMVKRTLERAVPDATPEERDNFGLKYLQQLIEAILEVNGLKVVEEQKKTISNSTNGG